MLSDPIILASIASTIIISLLDNININLNGFYKLLLWIGKCPCIVLIVTLAMFILYCIALGNLQLEGSIRNLWTPTDSPIWDAITFTDNYWVNDRQGLFVFVAESRNPSKDNGNILSVEHLREFNIKMKSDIPTIHYTFTNEADEEETLTSKIIPFCKPAVLIPANAYTYTHSSFEGIELETLGNTIGLSCPTLVGTRLPYNYLYCGETRVILMDSIHCLAKTIKIGTPQYTYTVLTYSFECPEITDSDLDEARELYWKWLANVIDWRLNQSESWGNDKNKHLKITMWNDRTGPDFSAETSSADFVLIFVSYFAMIIFAALTAFRPNNLFLSKSEALFFGVVLVVLSDVATTGSTGSFLMPLIAIGFGVDDVLNINKKNDRQFDINETGMKENDELERIKILKKQSHGIYKIELFDAQTLLSHSMDLISPNGNYEPKPIDIYTRKIMYDKNNTKVYTYWNVPLLSFGKIKYDENIYNDKIIHILYTMSLQLIPMEIKVITILVFEMATIEKQEINGTAEIDIDEGHDDKYNLGLYDENDTMNIIPNTNKIKLITPKDTNKYPPNTKYKPK